MKHRPAPRHRSPHARFRAASADELEAPRRKAEPAADVLFQDEHFIIVNKSPGAWLDEPLDDSPCVLESLVAAGKIDSADGIQPVYPLEPGLSGVAIFARTPRAIEASDQLILADGLRLTCRAIVQAHLLTREGVIPGAVPQRLRTGPALRYLDTYAREPRTAWTLVDALVAFAVIDCLPFPAYPSLVRAHLELAGMPLAVDPAFGGSRALLLSSFKAGYHPSKRHAERPLIARTSLHVHRIEFPHPFTHEEICITAEPPKDFRATLHQLDRFGRIARA